MIWSAKDAKIYVSWNKLNCYELLIIGMEAFLLAARDVFIYAFIENCSQITVADGSIFDCMMWEWLA